MAGSSDLERGLERERARAARAESQLHGAEARLLETERELARLGELELELRELGVVHAEALERFRLERDELAHRLERAVSVQAQMASSVSWRVTAPLRAVKRRAG